LTRAHVPRQVKIFKYVEFIGGLTVLFGTLRKAVGLGRRRIGALHHRSSALHQIN
jgi:hypothetical protein